MLAWLQQNWRDLLWAVAIMSIAIGVGFILRSIVLWLLRRATRRKGALLGQSLVRHSQGPTHWIFPLITVLVVSPELPLPSVAMSVLQHVTGLGLIAAVAWLVILLIEVASDVVASRYRVDVADNLVARRIRTQFLMLRRVTVILVVVITLAVMLMTFPGIRHIGTSILASAGVASLIVGMAMKDTLANLIAGVQIAFAQPFRVDDAVVVEGEWGWIEEIGMMYVVVRIWDLRRLVLPLSYFLEHPFQNWTRTSADILGSCFIYADYSLPVEEVRAELLRICKATPLWRGQVCGLQVTDATEKAMQLRALMDARNSSDAWDLRCLVREKLIDFIQRNYPASLPRFRGEFAASVANNQPALAGEAGPGGTPAANFPRNGL